MMILVLFAAAAQAAAQPLPASPPSTPSAEAGAPRRAPRQQVFVAPSGEPFRAAPDAPYPVADWFARANTKHDGKLTEAQFTADFVRFAETLDLNHDGAIDSAEVQNYETDILPELHAPEFPGRGPGGPGNGAGGPGGERGQSGWGGQRGGGGWGGREGAGGGAPRPKGAGRFELLPLAEPITAMDTASDGRITRAEMLAAAHARFAALDTMHRGYLQLGDLPETWVQSRRRMFQRRERGGGDNFRSPEGVGDGAGGGDQSN